MDSIPLVNVVRSGLIESRHHGIVSIIDAKGEEIATLGDSNHKTFLRSAAKPIQALPLVVTGGADRFNLTDKELAVICASHNGEEVHVKTVKGILAKAGLDESSLECGSHLPYDQAAACKILAEGRELSPLYNNCSGKHAGMLLLCVHLNFPLKGYIMKEHPLQKLMHETVADLAAMNPQDIHLGVDGCGVAVFAMPINRMALLFAKLANPQYWPDEYNKAAQRITRAMEKESYMVGGKGRLCTELMSKTNGKLVSKGGAEGVYCIGIHRKGLGVAIKIEDGRSRGLDPVVIKVLNHLGVLNRQELADLADFARPTIRNHRQETIGCLETCFEFKDATKFAPYL